MLGFNFQKGRIRQVLLEKHDDAPICLWHGVIKIDPKLELPKLMERYRRDFSETIDHHKPDILAVRQIWETRNANSAVFQVMPVGLLALVAYNKNVPLFRFSPQALVHAGPFGLPKKTKPQDAVEDVLGAHPPNWDAQQRYAALVAWRALLDA